MASFAQHVNTAVVISGIAIAPLYSSNLVDINQALVLLFFGTLGGVLPDIDLENSKPIQITSSILSVFIPLLAILTLLESLSITKMLFIWFLSAMILHFIIFKIFFKFTVHRGIIHSIPMGFLFAQILIISFSQIFEFQNLFSLMCGMFLFMGFLIHLILDELISLNAFGISFKKSLGSALKIFDRNNFIGSIILYLSIIILQILYPLNLKDVITIFDSLKNINL